MGEYTTVSLFSGAGGLDLGLEEAGWDVLAQIEMDADSVGTLKNHAESRGLKTDIIPAHIENMDPRSLRTGLGLRKGALALLAGGPPCQPFTTTGLRQATNDRRASSLFPAYFRFVAEFEPQAILIENVDGLLSAALRHRRLIARGKGHPTLEPDEQKGSFLRWFLGCLVEQGYSVAWGVLEAADHGVPQMRQRAILLGIKGEGPCYLPPAEFGWPGLPAYRTARWALSNVGELGPVQPLSQRKKDVYALVPPGGNWRNLPEDVRKATMGAAYIAEGGKSGWWRRLSWEMPAPTILGMPDHSSTALIHPDELRCLSVNECAAIQTFPPDVRFAGSSRSQYQQIGNAVPVLMARRLGEHLRGFLEGERGARPGPPPWRQASANRRIGTHGWVTPSEDGPRYCLNAQVRPDHVWATKSEEATLVGF